MRPALPRRLLASSLAPTLALLALLGAQVVALWTYRTLALNASEVSLGQHALVLGVFVLAADALLLVLAPLVPRRALVPASAAMLAAAHVTLFVATACYVAGMHIFSSVFTLDMLRSYAHAPENASALLGAPVSAVYGALALLFGALALAYARWVRWRLARPATPGHGALVGGALVLASLAGMALPPTRTYAYDLVYVWATSRAVNMAPPGLYVAAPRAGLADYLARVDRSALRPRPVVLVVVDALRADRMHLFGAARETTPFLDSLARAGVLDTAVAYSACTNSLCGIPAILGSQPWSGLDRPPLLVSEVLRPLGYQTTALLSGDHTYFFNLRALVDRGFDRFFDGTDLRPAAPNDDRAILDTLRTLPLAGARTFLYVHLMSAHLISNTRAEHRRWHPSDVAFGNILQEKDPVRTGNRYDNGVRQTDATLRGLFGVLHARGLLDSALVVVTADHGELLGEHGLFHHNAPPWQPVVRVPLLVYDPMAPPYAPRPNASVTDAAPTLAQALGLPVPPFWAGVPLQRPYARRVVPLGAWSAVGAVGDVAGGRYSYQRYLDGRREVLFDLRADPGETRDVSGDPARRAALDTLRRAAPAL